MTLILYATLENASKLIIFVNQFITDGVLKKKKRRKRKKEEDAGLLNISEKSHSRSSNPSAIVHAQPTNMSSKNTQ